MIQKIQKYYEAGNLSGPVASVINVEIGEAQTLKAVKVSVGANVSGADAVFELYKNGVKITGADVTIAVGAKKNETTGLNIALAEDDELDLKLAAGQVSAPVVLQITVDDDRGIDDLLPGQTGNAGKILKTDGTTASWQTESGGAGLTTVFEDDFTGTSINGSKWGNLTGWTQNGYLEANSNATLVIASQAAYNMFDRRITVEVPQVSTANASHATGLLLSYSLSGQPSRISIDTNNNILRCFTAGNIIYSSLAYNSTNHRWWRISIRYGGVSFQVSANGSYWNTIFSAPIGSTQTPQSMYVFLQHYNNAGGAATVSRFDNLKIESFTD